MSEPSSELLPLYETSRGFDTAMRGYDREQVDREIGRLDDDLRVTAAERDQAASRSADLAAQLANAQAQIESLRRQLRAATELVTPSNVDERVRHILDTAKADASRTRDAGATEARHVVGAANESAARTRAEAQAEAERMVAEATARLAEADTTYRQKITEAESRHAEIQAALAEAAARSRAEQDRLSAEAQAERQRLDAEAEAARKRANEDFEITLRMRRTAELKEQAEQRAATDSKAAETLSGAVAKAEQLVADATYEVRRLHTVRDEAHVQLEQLQAKLQAALDEVRAITPAAPELPASD